MRLVLADMGLPMIALEVPILVAAFVPIVLVETLVIARRLDLRFGRVFRLTAFANFVSTVCGVPLAWALMLGVECAGGERLGMGPRSAASDLLYAFGHAAWMPPNANAWMLGLAFFVLAVPAFFASVWLEWHVLERRLEGVPRAQAKKAVWIANAISYLGLVIVVPFVLML
jgi:hypothetical protein